MSRSLGSALDAALLRRLAGPDLAARAGEAIVVVTVDAVGRPHPALLSCAEVLARDAGRIRVAVAADSSTARNLQERRALTLCFVDGARVVYLKARTPGVPGGVVANHPFLRWFDAQVDDVRIDEARPEEAVTRVAGFTFTTSQPAERLRAGAALQASLRAAR